MESQIIQGDCTEVLKTIPDGAIDFILTAPPYGVRYQDRSGRTIQNDNNLSTILGAFTDLYRVLKPDSFCISFYGWNKVDAFFNAWTSAGFRPVSHIVWPKDYSSNSRFMQYRHEQAYLLAKGRPAKPAKAISDVQPWEYTGNRSHPTEKAVSVLTPLIEAFSRPGEIVLDPFSGSGSTAVAAALSGRKYLGIELEGKYCDHARKRLAGVERHLSLTSMRAGA